MVTLSSSLILPFNASAERRTAGPRSHATVVPALPSRPPVMGTFNVYGPQRFTRNSGQAVNVVENFSIPTDAVAPFAILIENGSSSGSNRVTSATIRLNGTDLYTSSDFTQGTFTLTKPVTLVATNTLKVSLSSAQGSYLTVSFTATSAASQPTLDSVTPARTTQGQTLNVTLRGSNTHWIPGQTRASLGDEVAVGGAGSGELGPVNVVDATTAIAAVVVSPTATLEPRTARVVTTPVGGGPDESLSLA